MGENLKPVVYIVGPTAGGKTALSVQLAQHFGGEIICGDSMQIYRNMPIATAAPTKSEKAAVPHRLFEFLSPAEEYSVSRYVADAKREINAVHAAGHLPFVVGGTGLYIQSLAENVQFGPEGQNGAVRAHLQSQALQNGTAPLYARLQQCDPAAAEKINPNDQKRIIRALEVFETTGERISERAARSKAAGQLYRNLVIGVFFKNRELLYSRINARVEQMLQNGLLQEAAAAGKAGPTACQAIGHKELFAALQGQEELSTAVERLKQQTRRYAKRQITWFSKMPGLHPIYMDESPDPFLQAAELVGDFLKEENEAREP